MYHHCGRKMRQPDRSPQYIFLTPQNLKLAVSLLWIILIDSGCKSGLSWPSPDSELKLVTTEAMSTSVCLDLPLNIYGLSPFSCLPSLKQRLIMAAISSVTLTLICSIHLHFNFFVCSETLLGASLCFLSLASFLTNHPFNHFISELPSSWLLSQM